MRKSPEHRCGPDCGPHVCEGCGREFAPAKRADQQFCSATCRTTTRRAQQRNPCSHAGCDNLAMPGLADGLCQSHHRRRLAGADMERPLKRPVAGRDCTHPGCSRPLQSQGLCGMHRHRKRRGLDMDAPLLRDRENPREGVAPCAVEGCTRKYRAAGLCSMHYARVRDTGDVGPPGPLRTPGVVRSKTGYLYDKGRAVHRMVIEEAIGRPLLPRETVHHKNGRRDDNRPENLELWVKPQPAGQRVADLVAFVVDNYTEAVRARLAQLEQGEASCP